MFILTTVVDTIRIPATSLTVPSVQAIHSEIDLKYPNRILMDIGLVIGRYGDVLQIGHGVCVAGDGGCHHRCRFRLIVFRPVVEEVCTGKVHYSNEQGVQISLGFFRDIFVPAYWMLNPSKYEHESGLWVWIPQYDGDEDGDNNANEDVEGTGEDEEGTNGADKAELVTSNRTAEIEDGDQVDEENRYEMELGAEIRFKVKSINFTQITNTAKGMQATTTTTATQSSSGNPGSSSAGGSGAAQQQGDSAADGMVLKRRRSSSVGLDQSQEMPAAMHIVASICEDGLGLTSWWTNQDEDEEEEEEEEGLGGDETMEVTPSDDLKVEDEVIVDGVGMCNGGTEVKTESTL